MSRKWTDAEDQQIIESRIRAVLAGYSFPGWHTAIQLLVTITMDERDRVADAICLRGRMALEPPSLSHQ